MVDSLKNIALGLGLAIAIVATIVVLSIVPTFRPVRAEYTFEVDVDKSEKVEQVLANGVEDVKSRDFIIIGTSVRYCWIDKTFNVRVQGIRKGTLLAIGN